MFSVEIELNKMKADSMAESGKRLEALAGLIARETSYVNRVEKILGRIVRDIDKQKRKKRKMWKLVKERIDIKLAKSLSAIRLYSEEKKKIYDNLIIQREAAGLTDHSWLEKYYGDKK